MDGSINSQVGQLDYVKLPPSNVNSPRPYRCEVCQRSFREVATLRKHEQLHRADRPYVCTTCGKSFLWSSNLKVHERVHTGERPYKCKICHRCFTQSNDLRRHERNVHMRGKFYGYKNLPSRQANNNNNNNNYNFAAYQAFALQQRALLQQAFTYENLMQNAALSQTTYLPPSGSKPEITLPTDNQDGHQSENRSPIKLEQVTPPLSPNSSRPAEHDRRESSSSLNTPAHVTSPPHDSGYISSPGQSTYSHLSMSNHSAVHSPPPILSQSDGGTHSSTNSKHIISESPGPPLKKRYTSGEHLLKAHAESNSMIYTSFECNDREQAIERGINGSSPNKHQATSGLPQYIPQENTSSVSSYYESASVSDNGMDLRVNKSNTSRTEDTESENNWKDYNSASIHSRGELKPPSVVSESDEKLDVTTTSETPTSDNRVHHCPHCNILFKDYTMYHLHEALHLPDPDYPFTCPSCQKQCQDHIEFNFHIVWHVKYPNTIPNYQPFKESYLT